MKSIHFNQVPDMRGKKTIPFTDMEAINFKEKYNARFDMKLAQQETDPFEDEIYDVWYDWEDMYDD